MQKKCQTRKIILKLGGSVITHKDKFPPQIDMDALSRLSHEIYEGWKAIPISLLLVHGAGCFGHIPAHRYNMTSDQWHEEKRQGAVEIRQWMSQLNYAVVSSMTSQGLPCIAYQPSACCVMGAKKIKHFALEPIKHWIEQGLIPVMYGDVVCDTQTGIDILSGDQIVSYLARALHPDLVIMGTDVDGVYSQDPKKNPHATLLPEIVPDNLERVLQGLAGSSHVDVTGGMAGKIRELSSLASEGIPVHLVNARPKGNIEHALMEQECPGTWIK